METISISEFKAKCLAILERVRLTRQPVRITRFGKPVAEILPPSPPEPQPDWMGSMQHRGLIVGDIINPATTDQDWDVLRE